MAHSTQFVPHTCPSVRKEVRKLNLTDLIAAIEAGDATIEEALAQAALRGAATAQRFGAERIRGAFDGYINVVENTVSDEVAMKLNGARLKNTRYELQSPAHVIPNSVIEDYVSLRAAGNNVEIRWDGQIISHMNTWKDKLHDE